MDRRRFLGSLAAGSTLLVTGANGLASNLTPNVHYLPVRPRISTGVPEGKVQVLEIFWYGCPHCYNLQPLMGEWMRSLPDAVEFSHLPAAFNDLWALHARVYYAAVLLDVLETVHQPFFDAIHGQGRNMQSESAILRFIDQRGLDADAFRDVMRSQEVADSVNDAALLVQALQVQGVPSMAVDGRALVSASMAGSYGNMLAVVNELIRESL
jgi:thiol:disulfide interchange protein DsbA